MINELEQQIQSILKSNKDKQIKVSYILSQLDFSYIKEDSYSKYPLSAIARLYIFKIIKGFGNYHKLIRFLHCSDLDTFKLGFYRRIDNSLDLPPKRTFNNYLKTNFSESDRKEFEYIAEKILSLATNAGVLLDLEIVKKTINHEKKENGEKIREATKLVKKLFYSNIEIPMYHNVMFSAKDLLDVLTHVALTHCFANNGSRTFKEQYPDRKVPSGDVMLYHFSKFTSISQVEEMFQRILDVVYKFAKKHYSLFRHRKLDLAFDIHQIPYYGRGIPFVCSGKQDRGTTSFFEFLTCSIVENGRRFILDVIPMSQFDNLADCIERSLLRVKQKIPIGLVYCDRGFNAIDIFRVFKKHRVKFLMPFVKYATVKAAFDKSVGCPARVFENFKYGEGSREERINLILVDDDEGIKRAFVTNFRVPAQIAYRLYSLYSKRWGIETGYRSLDHDLKPRTTSKKYIIRLFYFLFTCCLHNLWVLVNICISIMLYGRVKEKPILTAKHFTTILCMIKYGYLDPG